MPIVARLALAWLAGCLVATHASAGESGITLRGAWGGAVKAVHVDETDPDLVYLGCGRRLVILRVTDNPAGGVDVTELGSLDLRALVHDVKVRDGYAYIATAGTPYYFCVADVSDPAAPSFVWTNEGESIVSNPRGIMVHDDVVYVRTNNDIVIYGITNPESPQILRTGIGSDAMDSVLAGGMMYLGTDGPDRSLRVYEILPDGRFSLRGASEQFTIQQFVSVAVEGGLVCATGQPLSPWLFDGDFGVFDVSDPDKPTLLAKLSGFRWPTDVALSGGYAYVTDWAGSPNPTQWAQGHGLLIYDVATDPTDPQLVATYKPHGTVNGIEVHGDRAYLADEGEGLVILDVSDPSSPVKTGGYHSPALLRRMDKQGDLLFVTDAWNGVSILDVSDPDRPVLVGEHQSPLGSGIGVDHWGIKASGDRVYYSAGYGGLEVLDVSTPSAPELLGAFRLPANMRLIGLDATGTMLHAGLQVPGGNFLLNLDASDPQAIIDVGSTAGGGKACTIDMGDDGIAHLASNNAHTIFDNMNPAAPELLSATAAGFPCDLQRRGSFVYIAGSDDDEEDGGLWIKDVSVPWPPAARIPLMRCTGIALDGPCAFFPAQDPEASLATSVLAARISDPVNPVIRDRRRIAIDARHIIADSGRLYITGLESGLAIFDHNDVPADINGDGAVDAADLSVLVGSFGQATEPFIGADINGDGAVDAADLSAVLGAFGGGL